MKNFNAAQWLLQLHIGLIRTGAMPVLIATLFALGAASWIWVVSRSLPANEQQGTPALAPPAVREPPAAITADGGDSERNLRDFLLTLGDPAQTEQHLKIIFNIAARTGLELEQGEYKWEFDRNSRTYRYQVLLPIKGTYGLVRRFCERVLLALPFASLDELRFKRESIGDDALDGSVRFTLYLTPQTPTARKDSP